MRYPLLLILLAINSALSAFSADFPDRFWVRQDPLLRLFRIHDEEKHLGVVVNSSYGQLDFYDNQNKRKWFNLDDFLYDISLCHAWVKIASDEEWFPRSKRIELFSRDDVPLAVFDSEGDIFKFRDPDTQHVLAWAILHWMPTGRRWPSFRDIYNQEWAVSIVDRTRLEEKGVSPGMLIWVLMKHTQKHLPSPQEDLPYYEEVPPPP